MCMGMTLGLGGGVVLYEGVIERVSRVGGLG